MVANSSINFFIYCFMSSIFREVFTENLVYYAKLCVTPCSKPVSRIGKKLQKIVKEFYWCHISYSVSVPRERRQGNFRWRKWKWEQNYRTCTYYYDKRADCKPGPRNFSNSVKEWRGYNYSNFRRQSCLRKKIISWNGSKSLRQTAIVFFHLTRKIWTNLKVQNVPQMTKFTWTLRIWEMIFEHMWT